MSNRTTLTKLAWRKASTALRWKEGSVVVVHHPTKGTFNLQPWYRPDWVKAGHLGKPGDLLFLKLTTSCHIVATKRIGEV